MLVSSFTSLPRKVKKRAQDKKACSSQQWHSSTKQHTSPPSNIHTFSSQTTQQIHLSPNKYNYYPHLSTEPLLTSINTVAVITNESYLRSRIERNRSRVLSGGSSIKLNIVRKLSLLSGEISIVASLSSLNLDTEDLCGELEDLVLDLAVLFKAPSSANGFNHRLVRIRQ